MQMINQKTFDANLRNIPLSGKKLAEMIHQSAIFALHACNIGRTAGIDSPMQKLWNSIHDIKAINQQAFMQWAQEYGMCRFIKDEVTGKFLVKFYDKTKKSADFNPEQAVEIADEVPFWEFAKEPNPNLKPFDVFEQMRAILANAKKAEMGGAKGDKPKRQVLHKEGLDVLAFIINNPHQARQRLGLLNPSEETTIAQEDETEVQEENALLKAA